MAKIGILSLKQKKILKILLSNPEGLRAKTIESLSNIKERTLYNNLKKLESKKLIQNIFPVWKLCQTQTEASKMAKLLDSDKLQCHKFSFILRLLNKPTWWEKRDNKLMKLEDFNFKPVTWGHAKYEQLQKSSFLIQTFANSIVFINQKKYWGKDSYECYINSLLDTINMLNFIEERFKYKFFNDGVPQFSVRTQHYVKVMDEIAQRCKKKGRMLEIIIDGKLRAWTDLSDPYGLEFGHKNYAPDDIDWYKQFIDDGIRHRPPKLSEVMESIMQLTEKINALAEENKQIAIGLNGNIKITGSILKLMAPMEEKEIKKDKELTNYFG